MLKIGIFGVGHLGTVHVQLLQELSSDYEIVGFVDLPMLRPTSLNSNFVFVVFQMLSNSLICVIALISSLLLHSILNWLQLPSNAVNMCSSKNQLHKPLSRQKKLLQLASEASVQVQVGHVERFNPAFIGALPHINRPIYIEIHRLTPFSKRGTDVSVVLDLMIHDLDIVLSVVNSQVKRVVATGVAVMSSTPDIANARIEFDNGCVANITASRISKTTVRKAQFFQRNASITVDFAEKKVEIIHQTPALQVMEKVVPVAIEKPSVSSANAIQDELRSFAHAIHSNSKPVVCIEDACRTMELATIIMERLKITTAVIPNMTVRSAF